MKLHHEHTEGMNLITGYGPGFIAINQERHTRSLVVTANEVLVPWGAAGFDALTEADFATLAALPVAIVLIGTGGRQRFPAPALLKPLIEARRGFEIMDTAAACRTYTILAGERRSVAAALILSEA